LNLGLLDNFVFLIRYNIFRPEIIDSLLYSESLNLGLLKLDILGLDFLFIELDIIIIMELKLRLRHSSYYGAQVLIYEKINWKSVQFGYYYVNKETGTEIKVI